MHTTIVALPGDTWGISGPDFLLLYWLLICAIPVVAGFARRAIRREPPPPGADRTPVEADPYQVAYLNGGRELAVLAAIGSLRVSGSIAVRRHRFERAGEPVDPPTHQLELALLESMNSPVSRPTLLTKAPVRAALDRLDTDLRRRGLLLSEGQRTRMRMWSLPMLALGAFGLYRASAGLANDKAVGFLAFSLIVVALMSIGLLRVPDRGRTEAGDAELARLRAAHPELSPDMRPNWVGNGAGAAALGVGLFGVGALASADPALADEVSGQPWWAGSASGGSSGSASSCSSGSSCGGGGGCGGGGCGG